MEINYIKILSENNGYITIHKSQCIYMDPGYLNMSDLTRSSYTSAGSGSNHCIYGIWYKSIAYESVDLSGSDTFIPMTAIFFISFK